MTSENHDTKAGSITSAPGAVQFSPLALIPASGAGACRTGREGDHAKGKEHANAAKQHSQTANQHSDQAHNKSQQQK